MASFELRVQGLDKLNAALLELGTNGARRAGKKALRQGTNVILTETKARAPVRTGNLRKSLYTHDRGIKGDSILFSVDLRGRAFYGKFVEFGTSKMTARPFMRPAAETHAQQAVNVIAGVLGAAIEVEAAKVRA